MKAWILGAIICLTGTIALAGQTSISDIAGLIAVSSQEGNDYTLNSGYDYSIDGQIDFAGRTIILNADTKLSITTVPADYQLRVHNFTINGGDLYLKSDFTFPPLQIGGVFEQNGGTVETRGGNNGNGIEGYDDGTGNSNQFNYILNNGTLKAYGGDINESYGISQLYDFFMYDGNLIAKGGTQEKTSAIVSPDRMVLSGGNALFQGGSGKSSSGLIQPIEMTVTGQANVRALGGSESYSDGIYLGGNLQVTGGDIYAQGGSVSMVAGMSFTGTVTQSDGDIIAEGGSGENAFGFSYYKGEFSGGTLTATAGTGTDAWGMLARDDVVQTGGVLTGQGGDGPGLSMGMVFGDTFEQQAGTLIGIGGTIVNSRGVYMEGKNNSFAGTVQMERGSNASSSIYSTEDLRINSGAIVMPGISWSTTDNDHVAGLLFPEPG